MYVKNHFEASKKATAKRMFRQIKESFFVLLNTTEWMDETTKEKALEKVKSTINFKSKFRTKLDYLVMIGLNY